METQPTEDTGKQIKAMVAQKKKSQRFTPMKEHKTKNLLSFKNPKSPFYAKLKAVLCERTKAGRRLSKRHSQ